MKLQNGMEIVSLEQQRATVTLRAPLGQQEIRFDPKLPERIRDVMQSSNWGKSESANFDYSFRSTSEILPKEEDYIYVPFRSLSKVVVQGQWIDWSKDNVLKDAVPLLRGATVYPNHNYFDVDNWLGSVSQAEWDEAGTDFGGVAGINAEYKIDALIAPKIARGLLMKPPAIHSTSLTLLFEFEYSHPEIAHEDRYKFIRLLGEEVDGKIVRFVVTKIHEIWEASLVFQGADRLAKQAPTTDNAQFSATNQAQAKLEAPKNHKEKTMKLTTEQIATLQIEAAGDDVPETLILDRALSLANAAKEFDGVNLTELQAKAATAEKFVEQKREEVSRLARLAELGAEEGDLDEFVSQQIAEADFDRLTQMEKYFGKRSADRLGKGRSSEELSAPIDEAGGFKGTPAKVPTVGLHD